MGDPSGVQAFVSSATWPNSPRSSRCRCIEDEGSALSCPAVEQACRERAVGTLRLDTRAALEEACAMYERNGFERVDAFSDEPYSDRWYSKTLEVSVR